MTTTDEEVRAEPCMTKVKCTHCGSERTTDGCSGGAMIYEGNTVGTYGDHNCDCGHMGTWVEIIDCKQTPPLCIHCQKDVYKPKASDWEKEFDKQFPTSIDNQYTFLGTETRKYLKSFIASELKRQREEIVEKLEGMKIDMDEQDYPKYCGCDGECFGACQQSRDYGRNITIDEAIKIVRGE
jgi:hypothetical protein